MSDGPVVQSQLVSIVIPVFNRERMLPKTLESCLNQTYEQLECVVVDDGSTDRSVEVAQRWASRDSRVRVVRMPENRGVATARNFGFSASRGEWIQCLDSDDTLSETMLADEVRVAQTAPDPQRTVVYTAYCRVAVAPDGSLSEAAEINPIGYADPADLLRAYRDWYFTPDAVLHHCSMLFPRALMERYSYDERFLRFTDFHLLLRMLLDGVHFRYAGGDGRLFYHQHDDAITRDWAKSRRSHVGVMLSLAKAYPGRFRDYPHAGAMLRDTMRLEDEELIAQVMAFVEAAGCDVRVGKRQYNMGWAMRELNSIGMVVPIWKLRKRFKGSSVNRR